MALSLTDAQKHLTDMDGRIGMLDNRLLDAERRLSNVEGALHAEVLRATSVDSELKELLIDIRNKNPITEFFTENWKYIAIWIVISTGGDITKLLQALSSVKGI